MQKLTYEDKVEITGQDIDDDNNEITLKFINVKTKHPNFIANFFNSNFRLLPDDGMKTKMMIFDNKRIIVQKDQIFQVDIFSCRYGNRYF